MSMQTKNARHTYTIENIVIDFSQKKHECDVYIRELPERLDDIVALLMFLNSINLHKNTNLIHNKELDPSYVCLHITGATKENVEEIYSAVMQKSKIIDFMTREHEKRQEFLSRISSLRKLLGFDQN